MSAGVFSAILAPASPGEAGSLLVTPCYYSEETGHIIDVVNSNLHFNITNT